MTKKKSVFSELVERRRSDDRRFTTLNGSRWSFGYQVFRANIGKLVLLNVLLLISLAPIILLYLRRMASINESIGIAPFSANLGIGFMPYTKLVGLESSIMLQCNIEFFKFFALSSILFGAGIAGAMYVIRNMLWLTDDIHLFKDFLYGIRKNWGVIVLTFVYTAILTVCFMSISYADVAASQNESSWVYMFTKVMCFIAIGLFSLMYLNAITMSVTYKVKFFGLIKNSFLISVILLPLHAFFMALAGVPFVLFAFGGTLMAVGIAIIAIVGIAYALFVWSNYSHWIYEKFLQGASKPMPNESFVDVEDKNEDKGSIEKPKEITAEQAKKIIPVKPLGEDDPMVRDLPIVFSLADIEACEQSKNNMREDSDEYENKVKELSKEEVDKK